MKNLSSLFALMVLSLSHLFAEEPSASVTEAVNHVSHGPSQSTTSYPAKVGTVLHDGEYLKTGVASRAEMELSNQTITRLGANTIFDYSSTANKVDLQAGTILFSKPKDGKTLNIKTEAVTAAIVGTTGFFQVHGHGRDSHPTFTFGIIEGKATADANSKSFTIHAGQLLQYTPGSPPQIINFNVPLLVKTSHLLLDFRRKLPNQLYIDAEVIKYNDLVGRGFIRPPQYPYVVFDPNMIPVVGFDSAGNKLSDLNEPAPARYMYNPPYNP